MKPFFSVSHRSSRSGSRARIGDLTTAHGSTQTPAFVPVATKATLKGLTPSQVKNTHTELSFVNTYHLMTHPGAHTIAKVGGVHRFSGMSWSLMSDSGGFQVFSLAQRSRRAHIRGEEDPVLVKIDESGVVFRSLYDGSLITFTPETSMEYQCKIGADINMAFDECTYHPATYEYSQKSLIRTHAWLDRCISHRHIHTHSEYRQYLYGIIQGGCYEDLRVKSAQFVVRSHTDGVAIGGVSVGETKTAMRDQVRWVAPYLPEDRPVHLLGVGHLDDIRDLVMHGIDTFDCVEPTRLARLGILLTFDAQEQDPSRWTFGEINITNIQYRDDHSYIDQSSYAEVDGVPLRFSYLHHLFKQKELLGYTLASFYNVAVMHSYMRRIRDAIESGDL